MGPTELFIPSPVPDWKRIIPDDFATLRLILQAAEKFAVSRGDWESLAGWCKRCLHNDDEALRCMNNASRSKVKNRETEVDMNEILQQKLYDAGKELYKLRFLPCPEECLMGWGIQCPDEWFPQLMTLTQILEAWNQLHPDDAIHAVQVKTKIRRLRFHTDREWRENDFLSTIINCFEENVALPFSETRTR